MQWYKEWDDVGNVYDDHFLLYRRQDDPFCASKRFWSVILAEQKFCMTIRFLMRKNSSIVDVVVDHFSL